MSSEFIQFVQRVNKISFDLHKKVNLAMEFSNKIEKTVRQAMAVNSSQLLESFKNFNQGIIETEEDLRVFKYAMVELGYPSHLGLSISQMRRIAWDFEEDKEEVESYIDGFLKEVYDFDRLNESLMEWENLEILKRRLPLLRNAIMAHNLGMYHLVVPAILSQLEGFLVDLFGVKGKVDGKITQVLLKHLLLENGSADYGINFDDAIHKYYSEQILEQFEHGKTMKHGISRHAILHGADTQFGKETISLKVILLFDYLSYFSGTLSKESIVAAKEEINKMRKAKRQKHKRK